MARQLRIEFPDAVHHVTSRGNEQRDIFRKDDDRRMFLTILGQAVKRFGWSITAWVLMTNHFHLVVQTPEPNLSRGMQWLKGTYAGWFNRQYKRSGHLIQGRFKSFLIEKERYLREVLRYVVLNPVRAEMAALPEEYEWSSYRATAGLESAEPWLDLSSVRALFDPDPETAQSIYRDFVTAKVNSSERLWDQVINGMYLGSGVWAKRMRAMVESKLRSSDHPKKQRTIGRPRMFPDRNSGGARRRQHRRCPADDARRPAPALGCMARMARRAGDTTLDCRLARPPQRGTRVGHDPSLRRGVRR